MEEPAGSGAGGDAGKRELGNAAFKRGDLAAAVSLYEGCDDSDSAAHSNRSLCLLRLSRPADALAAATRACDLRPEWAKAWGRRAAALQALGDLEGAADILGRGLEAEPGNKELKSNLGEVLSKIRGGGGIAPPQIAVAAAGGRGRILLSEQHTLEGEGGRNVLVMLHGVGDSDTNFIELGRRLALPDTTLLALRAPLALPFDMGHCWVPTFDMDGSPIGTSPADQRRVEGLGRAAEVVRKALRACRTAGYEEARTFLLGFSQGAVVAAHVGARWGGEVGGVVALSGCLFPEDRGDATAGSPLLLAPMLVSHGTEDKVVRIEEARGCWRRLGARGGAGGTGGWREYRKGHETPRGEEEVRHIMEFLAPLMAAGNPAPTDPDIIEVTDPALIRSVLTGQAGPLAGGGGG